MGKQQMAENIVKVDISFQALLTAVLSLERAEKQKLWEFLETDLFANEEDAPEDLVEIQAARADYAAGDYITFDQYAAERASRSEWLTQSFITPKVVRKQLDDLPDDVYERIAPKIQQLAEHPRPEGVTKLKGSDREYRIRIGDYRVRYEIDDKEKVILLLQCKHRRDIYRK